MPAVPDTGPVEFIRLNGRPIRATSWQPGDDSESWRLVAIVRGSGDAASLVEVLQSPSLVLEIPDQESLPVRVRSMERRETGNAPATITRFVVEFERAADTDVAVLPARSLEARVDALEAEVAQLRKLVAALSNTSTIPRIDQVN